MESYARGPDAPVLDTTIGAVFRATAARFPDREAIVVRHQGVRLTWRQLAAAVDATAGSLLALGLAPGDRVGVWATNRIEWVLLQFACAELGLILVNINPAYRAHELSFVLRQSRIRALFLQEKDIHADYRSLLAAARDGHPLSLRDTIYLHQWDAFLEKTTAAPRPVTAPGDVVNIQYTSGTTGAPKGVLLTHRNLINNARFIAGRLNATVDDRLCIPVPLFHCFGCVIGTLVAAVTGAAVLLPSAQFDALACLETIHDERATAVYGVPTMFIAWLNHPRFAEFDLRSLRTGVMAGAPCPIEIMRRVVHEMHCREMTIAYGQTESSPVITMSSADDAVELRCTTVGRALPATEVKIVCPETGATQPAGTQGELLTRGYLVMEGYDQDAAATAKAVDAQGWLHTGDLAVMRPDGSFKMTGRAKDTIIRGGENIYPREVEEFLMTHPKVAEIYVVGLPDEKLGEIVAAWIRLRPGQSSTDQEIREFCDGQIAYFKVPQHIRFVDTFPMTANGKIQKFRIREHEIHARGLEAAARVATA